MKQEKLFENRVILDENTMQKIMLEEWTYNKGKNKIPVLVYLVVTVLPLIYGMIFEKGIYVIWSVCAMIVGFVMLIGYLVMSAIRAKKHWRTLTIQTIEKYGPDALLDIKLGEAIQYTFKDVSKKVSYSDVQKMLDLEHFIILKVKNGVVLPLWKDGFRQGTVQDVVMFLEEQKEVR